MQDNQTTELMPQENQILDDQWWKEIMSEFHNILIDSYLSANNRLMKEIYQSFQPKQNEHIDND